MFKSHKIALAVTISLACFCGNANAQIHNLQDLIDTMGFFEVEDLRFHSFSYSAVGQMPPAELVNVIEIVDGEGNPGFRLQGGFVDSASQPGASDALLGFKVDALGPDITDVHLSGNPNLLGTEGSISVTEEVFSVINGSQDELLARLDIFEDGLAGFKGRDQVIFNRPVRTIEVFKDILGIGIDGDVTMSRIDQTFSRVPEPTTSLLMLAGITALSLIRRKRIG